MEKIEHEPTRIAEETSSPLTAMHNGAIGTPQLSDAHRNGDSDSAVERAIDFRKMWAIVKKNWMVLRGDKIRLIPLFMFPIIMIIVFGFASGNIPKHISAAIVDYDNTDFTHMVKGELSGMDLFSIRYMVGTQDEGKRLLDEGKIRVLFILPEGIEKKVAAGEQAKINIMVDESDSSVAQIAKSSGQSFAQKLSAQVTAQRLSALSAQAYSARQDLAHAGAAMGSASNSANLDAAKISTAYYWNNMQFVYSLSSKAISDTMQGLKNSLGYLVDQNEVVSSFTPASVSQATLALLATGDQQQSVLQSIGSYAGMRASQAKMAKDAAGIYGNYQSVSAQASAQKEAAAVSAAFISAADSKLDGITTGAAHATAPVTLLILEPYGYGRRGIDFLLASILALTIFQGATMGLGRAIAGERKDGSMTRVFLTPTSNVTIILGTQLFYMMLETVRSSMIIFVAIALFGVSISGNILDMIVVIAIFAMGATGVGMVLSVITKNQEQYMAVGMLISLPIMFLSGVFFPIQTMPPILQGFAQVLPVTYAADALRGVMVKGFTLAQVMPDIAALLLFALFTLTLSLMLFKRELV